MHLLNQEKSMCLLEQMVLGNLKSCDFCSRRFRSCTESQACKKMIQVFCEQIIRNDKHVFLTTHNPLVLDGLDILIIPMDGDVSRKEKSAHCWCESTVCEYKGVRNIYPI